MGSPSPKSFIPSGWDWRERESFEAMARELWFDIYRQGGDVSARYSAELERRAAEKERQRLSAIFSSTGVAIGTEDFAAIEAGTLRDTPALAAVKAWLSANEDGQKDPRFLVLLGGVGVGKTLAAAWALHRFGGTYTTPEQLENRTAWSKLFVLDDLGTETHPAFQSRFFELVNSRMRTGNLTIITGNLSRAQVRERYDARIIDRLNHSGKALELGGASLRKNTGGL